MSAAGNGQGRAGPGRSRRGVVVALGAAVLVAGVALAVVALRGPSHPRTLQDRVRSVAQELRCPECQNLSVADSPSGIAGEMRGEIARRLRLGQSPSRIDDYFVARYGRWILLTPDAGGIGLVAWLAPALAVAVGGGLAWTVIRRRRGGASTGADRTTEAEGPGTPSGKPRLTDDERDRIRAEIAELEEIP